MKLLLLLSALAGSASATKSIAMTSAQPVQTFYVPITEHDVFHGSFKPTNKAATGPVTSIISLAISTNDTVVWWDHWEDGYDKSITAPSRTTQVWGDGDISNGCAFGMPCKKDSDDVLVAGQSIVIENDIPLDHHTKKASRLYDSRDKISSSFHIAITRGGYPKSPGSYMAGAVEVYDTTAWGTKFEAPFGSQLKSTSDKSKRDAYEKTVLFFMAHQDDTRVTVKGQTPFVLNEGQARYAEVNQGDIIETTKDVQAHLVTSDLNSSYELRWYSLLATKYWSNKYMTPMGDSTAKTRVVAYNPQSNTLTVKVTTRSKTYNLQIPGKSSLMTEPIKTGEGAILESVSKKNFIAMSQTDTVSSGNSNDWGFPLVPFDQLTTQALIGWGYGCKGKTCSGTNRLNKAGSRSVVYVSCVDFCDIYVDLNNDGTHDLKFSDIKKVESTRIVDPKDHDMSGAIIWATKTKSGPAGTAVRIAAAWGQDPERSWGGDQEAMDLGTVVLPFGTVKVSETVALHDDKDKSGTISCGDVLKYTIRVQNMGQLPILPNQYTIKGPLEALAIKQRQYVKSSCMYDSKLGARKRCPDSSLGSSGLKNYYTLPKLGGFHDITFLAVVDPINKISTDVLPQGGNLYKGNDAALPFAAPTKMFFTADVAIYKSIHLGNVDCARSAKGLSGTDSKLARGPPGTGFNYCYRLTNTGASYLKLGRLYDPIHGRDKVDARLNRIIAPKQSMYVKVSRRILSSNAHSSTASIDANPVYYTGTPIPNMADVKDDDKAGYAILYPDADILLEKTVHLGHWTGCSKGEEIVSGYKDDKITYCYAVKNTGDTWLKDFKIYDPLVKFTAINKIPRLAPGKTFYLSGFKTGIVTTQIAEAKVIATPSFSSGSTIGGMAPVVAKDPAGVRLLAKQIVKCVPGQDPVWTKPGALSTIPVNKAP